MTLPTAGASGFGRADHVAHNGIHVAHSRPFEPSLRQPGQAARFKPRAVGVPPSKLGALLAADVGAAGKSEL
jgi:hypothetical protein